MKVKQSASYITPFVGKVKTSAGSNKSSGSVEARLFMSADGVPESKPKVVRTINPRGYRGPHPDSVILAHPHLRF